MRRLSRNALKLGLWSILTILNITVSGHQQYVLQQPESSNAPALVR